MNILVEISKIFEDNPTSPEKTNQTVLLCGGPGGGFGGPGGGFRGFLGSSESSGKATTETTKKKATTRTTKTTPRTTENKTKRKTAFSSVPRRLFGVISCANDSHRSPAAVFTTP